MEENYVRRKEIHLKKKKREVSRRAREEKYEKKSEKKKKAKDQEINGGKTEENQKARVRYVSL